MAQNGLPNKKKLPPPQQSSHTPTQGLPHSHSLTLFEKA